MDAMKTAARKVSEVVFPGMTVKHTTTLKKSEKVMSSLPLQMCLYFNVNYSPFWMLIRIGGLAYKFPELNQLYKILLTAVLLVMMLIEISRLYLGYKGNLTEKVPELAGFWLLTVLLQFPLQCLCVLGTDFVILPWERMTDIVLVIFLLLEMVVGFFALRSITHYQALKFKMQMTQCKSTETILEDS